PARGLPGHPSVRRQPGHGRPRVADRPRAGAARASAPPLRAPALRGRRATGRLRGGRAHHRAERRRGLYVPLPGTSGDEQTANARLVEAAGGAVMFPQVSLTPDGLADAVARLLADPATLTAMGERAKSLAQPDAADRIVRLLQEVAAAPR